MQSAIHYNKAQERLKEQEQSRQAEQEAYLQEYLESSVELLDARDIDFYSQMTGIPVEYLLTMHPTPKTP